MSQKLKYIINVIHIFFSYLKKWYRLLAMYFALSCIKQILWYKKYSLITQTFENNITISLPNNHLTLLVISEIFLFEMLKPLKWCKCVLDIGWYIWESAIYLSKQNKNVIVFEPDIDAYKILKKNITAYHNIISHNQFVTLDGEDLYINKKEDIDCGAKWSHDKTWIRIASTSIKDILANYHDIDGIKIDIEWGEYEILEYMLNKNLFNFKKWFIEFHFYDNIHQSKQFFIDFCEKIKWLGYIYIIFDNANRTIPQLAVQNTSLFLCNIYFEQWN